MEPKEDTDTVSPNAGKVPSKIKWYTQSHSSSRELKFDVLHAYIASKMRVFLGWVGSKRRY